jgi:DNA (cytosine-5)-methyltransferase 1
MCKPYTVVDLFSGVGGFSLGFIHAAPDNAFESRLLVDFDKDACFTFRKNYPNIPFLCQDVSIMTVADVKKHSGITRPDVIIGGPPCQGFSNAGKRAEEDERNRLVPIYAKLAMEMWPKVILMENVVNVLSSQHFKDLGDKFNECGYETKDFVLDAADYGVPQHRKRAFLLALRSTIAKKVGLSAPAPLSTANVTVKEAIDDLPSLAAGEGDEYCVYAKGKTLSDYQQDMRRDSHAIFNHCSRKHSPEFLDKIAIIPEGGSNRDLPPEQRFSDNYFSQAYARLHRDQTANTITTQFFNPGSGRFTHYRDLRSITVREAARLQSFPDKFLFHGPMAAQTKHVGNAVPPLLAKAWAHHIYKILQACEPKPRKQVVEAVNG